MARNRVLATTCGLLLCICPGLVLGYPAGNSGWHLNSPFQMRANADVVCKVRIRRVRDVGKAPHQLIPGGPEIRSRLAGAEVLSVVKGQCGDSVEIEYQFPAESDFAPALFGTDRLFTPLEQGESCLVFLQGTESPYRLNRIFGKACVVPWAECHTPRTMNPCCDCWPSSWPTPHHRTPDAMQLWFEAA